MPIYEYQCRDCGARLEKMQKVADAPLTVCEACGGKLEKQWSLSGIQFKGAGWYVNDYAAKKSGGGGKSETSEKVDKSEKSEKTEKSEKSSPAESTAKTETASKPVSDSSAKKD